MKIFKLFFLLPLVLTLSCSRQEKSLSKKPLVVVSAAPYLYFVKKIAEDTVEARTLIPINANPHLYEPTFFQINLATKAEIWFCLGEFFEKPLLAFLKKNNINLVVSDLKEHIELLSYENSCCDHADFKDIHIWTSPKSVKIQAQTIAKALIEKYPQNKNFYEKNLDNLLEELTLLDETITKKLKLFPEKAFLISHPAYAYFCKDYGLEQISIEYEGKEPSAKKLGQIFQKVKDKKIKKILVQAQYNNKGAQTIAKKLNLPLKMVDPYSLNYQEDLLKFTDFLIAE